MSLLGDIREGIVQSFTGTISYNQFTGYLLPSPDPPCFEIDFPPDGYVFHQGGYEGLTLIVRGIVALGDTTAAQEQLDEWLDVSGANSVKAALEADRTLGGKVQSLDVLSASLPRTLESPESILLCAEWTVGVLV